jgi:hypothetical protein
MSKFGISDADYNQIWAAQGSKCAICGKVEPLRGRSFHPVDHDHSTGRVRGILCQACNVGLGSFRDDPALLFLAIEYLKRSAPHPFA